MFCERSLIARFWVLRSSLAPLLRSTFAGCQLLRSAIATCPASAFYVRWLPASAFCDRHLPHFCVLRSLVAIFCVLRSSLAAHFCIRRSRRSGITFCVMRSHTAALVASLNSLLLFSAAWLDFCILYSLLCVLCPPLQFAFCVRSCLPQLMRYVFCFATLALIRYFCILCSVVFASCSLLRSAIARLTYPASVFCDRHLPRFCVLRSRLDRHLRYAFSAGSVTCLHDFCGVLRTLLFSAGSTNFCVPHSQLPASLLRYVFCFTTLALLLLHFAVAVAVALFCVLCSVVGVNHLRLVIVILFCFSILRSGFCLRLFVYFNRHSMLYFCVQCSVVGILISTRV